MKRVFGLFLGILTAFGGFIDIGDLVADAQVGSRFGLSLAFVTVAAVVIIMCFAEMSARIAMATRRAAFDVVRERLGPKAGLAGLAASFTVTAMLVMAELSGVALALELATSVNHLLFIPVLAVVVFLIIWKLPFELLETLFGVLGLPTLVWLVAITHLSPDWGSMLHGATHPSLPHGEGLPTMLFFAISLLGAQATPYETFFFSSGAVEQGWKPKKNLPDMRVNVLVGFPLGGILAIAIQAASLLVLAPRGISVQHLSATCASPAGTNSTSQPQTQHSPCARSWPNFPTPERSDDACWRTGRTVRADRNRRHPPHPRPHHPATPRLTTHPPHDRASSTANSAAARPEGVHFASGHWLLLVIFPGHRGGR